ncbi:sensor histidine kinase [Microbacterium sp. W4I4]|uniref:sensor histidine kinase n=1 Tax=Microbacterium sp. W4I4 TaxID=3042295 RepID=UPI0027D854C7|nr:histidine kinase [Microbacterium sp. W4I4]
MSSPATEPRRRRAAFFGSSVGLVVMGIVFDVGASMNVPGVAELQVGEDARMTVTDSGTALTMLVIAAWITVVWRRRMPLLALVAGCVLAVVGVSYVLLLVGAVAVVRREPRRMTWVAGITAALVMLFAIREALTGWGGALPWYFTTRADAQYEPTWIVMSFVWAVVSLGAATGIALYGRARREAMDSDQRAQRELQRADLLTEQMVRQAERERIARDMHDALAHRLSVVSLHAGALEVAAGQAAGAGGGVGQDAGEIARTVREQTHAALQDMRGLIGDLRGGATAPSAGPATTSAIGALLVDLRRGGAQISAFVVIESPERSAALFDSAVFRIVQESLTNAVKHAPGVQIEVYVRTDPKTGARIRVENPVSVRSIETGIVPGGGNGTVGIRERAAALDGTAWIGAHDGTFIVDVTLPWQERG